MATLSEALLVFCDWLIRSTVRAGVLILFILAVQSLLRARLLARWRCWFWVLLLVQMVMPWAPESRLSVFNLMPHSVRLSWRESATDTIPSDTFAPIVGLDSPVESPSTPHARTHGVRAAETPLAGTTAEPTALAPDSMEPVPTEPTSLASAFYKLVPFAWLGGAVVLAAYIGVTNFSLWRTVRRGRILTDQRTLDLLEQCKRRMGVRPIARPATFVPEDTPTFEGAPQEREACRNGPAQRQTPNDHDRREQMARPGFRLRAAPCEYVPKRTETYEIVRDRTKSYKTVPKRTGTDKAGLL